MISQDISLSAKIASLSAESLALFCLILPHLNAHGKMLADPHGIKGVVCPLIPWLDIAMIEQCLAEISEKTNLKWWRDERGLHYLQSLNWHEHQSLRQDRIGADRLPSFPGKDTEAPPLPEPLPDHSRSTPGPLRPEEEGKEEGKKTPSSDALRLSGLLADLIADNNPSNRHIKHGVREKTVQRWAQDLDRMIRIDGRDPEDVEAILRWCQADDFWKGTILSGAKLREHYDRLTLQMRRTKDGGQSSQAMSPVLNSYLTPDEAEVIERTRRKYEQNICGN